MCWVFGKTGTSMWVDPANDLFVILLSNRVNPTRHNEKIAAVRVALADAVLQTMLPRSATTGAATDDGHSGAPPTRAVHRTR